MNKSDTIWTAVDAIKTTGGRCASEGWAVSGISVDTRTLQKGNLFVALVGDNLDGHDYVKDALNKGAVAALVSKEIKGVSAEKLLIVEDTRKALEDLTYAARRRSAAKIIAVAGSVGATTTTEMLATAFDTQGQTHVGVPLALSSMHAGTDYGVFEMKGEALTLNQMVKPDITIITNTLKDIANFENVIAKQTRIFDGMAEGAMVVLNHDNEAFGVLKEAAKRKNLKLYSFGQHESASAKIIDCLEAANGSRVKAEVMGEAVSFSLQTSERHIVMNAVAVLLAVKLAGADVQRAAKTLNRQSTVVGRGRKTLLDSGVADNPITLIDESRNASPLAMNAAFKVMALIDPGRGGRRIAILGDMLEMSDGSGKRHADLALPLKTCNVDLVYTCGQNMRKLYDQLPANQRGAHKETSRELAEIVPDVLVPGDVVMVKGSMESKMGLVVEALRALPKKVAKTKALHTIATKNKI